MLGRPWIPALPLLFVLDVALAQGPRPVCTTPPSSTPSTPAQVWTISAFRYVNVPVRTQDGWPWALVDFTATRDSNNSTVGCRGGGIELSYLYWLLAGGNKVKVNPKTSIYDCSSTAGGAENDEVEVSWMGHWNGNRMVVELMEAVMCDLTESDPKAPPATQVSTGSVEVAVVMCDEEDTAKEVNEGDDGECEVYTWQKVVEMWLRDVIVPNRGRFAPIMREREVRRHL